ncbi:hypothetical protein LTR02_007949 [Friedmanniomyces endolithicus]|uniref:Ribosomal protein S15 n=1 Tax=Friedmanniomyces endolithicus TaxID=329885 RepID=A0A4U0UVG3_9PEZI|nr:hypothetical protein LTS09_007564 [Friedmanniomyces endolithicus]KAK0345625.1 hypothetical protein LTR94_010032 [Friedmanniomyces endolithicus]KAK0792089.1 hypothetical protein LTR75_011578 [Friedmanniomyces endolithicus]KAK0794142.1 hypothetical protein LTR38_009338 [Friedmanniomyces endolithicus]KAK0809010.1 hypothetical protein LTR59_002714 [Friedmanniomyces endolithicus]
MPPRLPLLQCLRAQPATSTRLPSRTFTTTPSASASTPALTPRQLLRKHDPYAIAQAKARKAANLDRRRVLQAERAASVTDPVRGTETPFLRSFDTASPLPEGEQSLSTRLRVGHEEGDQAVAETLSEGGKRNFFLSADELQHSIEHSKALSTPPAEYLDQDDPTSEFTTQQRRQRLADQQATAEEALGRIASLSLGNSQDRAKVNIQRCIATFGRHETDKVLTRVSHPSVSIAVADASPERAAQQHIIPRIGPDTGSSEVQIAILTAKIRTLADFLQTRGTTDKMNKRNLRLLVHRRQKHLRYLRREDRGGSRWQYCTEMLGLGAESWKGEISL